LSYPDWIVARLTTDLGTEAGFAALAAMDERATVSERTDGYVQDPASQAVAAAVDVATGALVVDLCAAPGGKATALAGAGARVLAGDRRRARAGLVAANATRLGCADRVWPVVADGTRPPVCPGRADAVVVDAPCSGLGVLRRRPDARWRIHADDVERLAALQRRLLEAAVTLVRPGGLLVYTVCTLTTPETVGIDEWLAAQRPHLVPLVPALPTPALPTPAVPWQPVGRGARVLPQDAGTDGMYLLRLTVPG
jgi:16S rRNA (cytosine967-C5)-methyltransferase